MDVISVENILLPLSTSYVGDDDLTFTSKMLVSEEGVSLFKENYLLSAIDARINNYSSLYLTNKVLGDDIFTFKKQDHKKQDILTASLLIPGTETALYAPEGERVSLDTTFSNKKDKNAVFELEIVNSNVLRIAHQRGPLRYYLCVVDGVFFLSTSTNNYPDTIFNYILSREQLFLFKIKNTVKKVIQCKNARLELVDYTKFAENYFILNNFTQSVDPTLNASWISYDFLTKNRLDINSKKSVNNLPLNYLISNQYSYLSGSDIPSNFIALKNHYTNNNYSNRVDITKRENYNTPSVSRREYTRLVTGCEQEGGDYNITVPYEFYTADFKFATDKFTIFKLPESLYPYESININDAAINLVGAIGGDTPYTSDRIFFKDTDRFISDGQYLCTWLYAQPNSPGIWLDRYYYPDQSSYIAALTSQNTNKEIDAIDSLLLEKLPPSAYYDVTYFYTNSSEELSHTPQTTKDALKNNYFFDKKSDLTFLPNNEYIYYRIGDSYVDSIVNALSTHLIQDGLSLKNSKNAQIINDTGEYVFDNNSYSIVETFRSTNESAQGTISFFIDTADWKKPLGHQILGNLNERGFSIINDPIVTPFIQVQDNLKVINLNSDFQIINTSHLSPVDFSPLTAQSTTTINYLYTTTTYFLTSYFIKDIIRTDHLDVHYPVVVSYSLSSLDQKSIIDDGDGGGDGKVTANDTCPVLLVDNPATTLEELLLADNVKLKVGNIPLTGIIIEPCNL